MKAKAKKAKGTFREKPKMCDPGMCDSCLYIGEGDFLCEKYQEIVVSDWEPTKYYHFCNKENEKFAKSSRKGARHGKN